MANRGLFEGQRLSLEESLEMTAESLRTYAEKYRHWILAYSGGKDSSATLAAVVHLIDSGKVPRPESFKVLYSDTRLELTPLQTAAFEIMREVGQRGIETEVVCPEMDDRFFVYIFGRGVPPPSNTFRWCTSQLKIEPMERAMVTQAVNLGFGEMVWNERKGKEEYKGFGRDKLLTITGVRLGESAVRDARIALSCSRDGAECGQGWLQQSAKEGLNDTLAPILHWRVCNVIDWLGWDLSNDDRIHGLPTRAISEAYGADEEGSDYEVATRTGCVGCNLASRDVALERVLKNPRWSYLEPYLRLKPLYAELKRPSMRLRKHAETNKGGELSAKQGRLGPLTMEARRYGLAEVLGVQSEINERARSEGRPAISLINEEEHARILELIEAGTWPDRWEGDEATGDEPYVQIYRDGTSQPLLLAE